MPIYYINRRKTAIIIMQITTKYYIQKSIMKYFNVSLENALNKLIYIVSHWNVFGQFKILILAVYIYKKIVR
ncbi:protein of unknown function [Brochothrix thermosphacta]|nr:protein of unknown function [Brochothrix thermosphacta]